MAIAMVSQSTFSLLFSLCLLSSCSQPASQEFLEVRELVVISWK